MIDESTVTLTAASPAEMAKSAEVITLDEDTGKTVKFQCTRVNSDFHIGDGRRLLGPRPVNPNEPMGESHEGDIAEIPENIALLGQKRKMGKIIK